MGVVFSSVFHLPISKDGKHPIPEVCINGIALYKMVSNSRNPPRPFTRAHILSWWEKLHQRHRSVASTRPRQGVVISCNYHVILLILTHVITNVSIILGEA